MQFKFPLGRTLMTALLAIAIQATSTANGQEDVVAKTADGRLPSATKKDDAKKPAGKYEFTVERQLECTDVKSQDSTGTCWSFATASFIESELIRREKGLHNLSEMFIVKNIYRDKARNFVLRQGKANFSQGALAHDFISSAQNYGMVPEEVFSGREDDSKRFDHSEMEAVMVGFLEAVAKQSKLSPKWKIACDKILDTYMGDAPERFTYRGRSYSAKEFAKSLEFRGQDYASITSFSHHPFYEPFVLEIPDNYSNGSFDNLPIDNVIEIIDNAIENGFTVAWDGDVSEKGFSAARGIAVLPANPTRRDLFTRPGEEVDVDQEMRQTNFESLETTDDHLMHLVGISRDQEGNKYYMVKNSWGEIGPYKGFVHISENYLRLKTISIIVHQDAVPPRLKSK